MQVLKVSVPSKVGTKPVCAWQESAVALSKTNGTATNGTSPPDPTSSWDNTWSGLLRAHSERGSENDSVGSDFDKDDPNHCGSHLVLREQSLIRLMWSGVLLVLIGYTATIFLYRFSFWTLHLGTAGIDPVGEDAVGWLVVDTLVDILFWADLVLNFFITYTDFEGREVDDLRQIAKHYLSLHFWLNLLACLPESFYKLVASAGDGDLDLRVARIYRLHRIQKLMRLTRLARLFKLVQLTGTSSRIWQWLQSSRYVRFANSILGLFVCVHMLACGWYLCAALHSKVQNTWVARHAVDSDGTMLLGQPPIEQWLVAMYFVLTIFTTVGFGDISAGTEAEIIYVALVMLVGTVVHSIIIGKVIGLVTSTDEVQRLIEKQNSMIASYAAHAQLDKKTALTIKREITWRAKNWATSSAFDKTEMSDLIMGKYMPRWLIAEVPNSLFKGALLRNNFLRCLDEVPPRLPCLLAIHLVSFNFACGEVVYQKGDFSFNIFLVVSGTFAHIARPSPKGGVDAKEAAELKVCADGRLKDHSRASSRRIMKASMSMKGSSSSSSSLTYVLKQVDAFHTEHLYPYRLLSYKSYFGDEEIMLSRPRLSTVQCMRKGACLTLSKSDFMKIQMIFPQHAASWARMAQFHERFRQKSLAKLGHGLDYKSLAALQILRFVRGEPEKIAPDRLLPVPKQKPLLLAPGGGAAAARGQKPEELPHLRKVGARYDPPGFSLPGIPQGACRSPERKDSEMAATRTVVDRLRLDVEILRKDTREAVDSLRSDIGGLRAEMRELLEEQRKANRAAALGSGAAPPVDGVTAGPPIGSAQPQPPGMAEDCVGIN